jgi:hypothetical protein
VCVKIVLSVPKQLCSPFPPCLFLNHTPKINFFAFHHIRSNKKNGGVSCVNVHKLIQVKFVNCDNEFP